ncbi:unnamed protein product [Adineta steineri]|uniref:Squalene cyclase C-terminal domain-containing protein n=1 Tax=Adineta steineri TaxID=433720 RepID=A0A818YZB0_9BILA|nr:unnamed protein product [Adineta steineri]CAF3840639.1 unnamed protein product [Adineta steineri]
MSRDCAPLIKELRNELYIEKYHQIDFTKHRHSISSLDLYTPQTYLLKILNLFTITYESVYNRQLCNKANEFLIDYIEAEDEHTNYINIGPVNKFINMLFKRTSKSTILTTFKSSQLWDTAFSIQAILETGLEHLYTNCLNSAYYYLEINRVLEDVKDYRHISKATLLLYEQISNYPRLITSERLANAINFILSSWLSPDEVFRGMMLDCSYTECTPACIQALWKFPSQTIYSNYRRKEIDIAIKRGIEFIKKQQKIDGSWAVCFTYGTWFAIEALITVGVSPKSKIITKAIEFLISKHNHNGGWGESYLSCVHKTYVPHKQSQVVNIS